MKDYPVIDRVVVVSVNSPIAGFNVNFYVSLYYPSSGGNDHISKISTTVIVHPSRVDYLYRLTVFSDQLGPVQQVLPDFNNLSLGEIVYHSPLPAFY